MKVSPAAPAERRTGRYANKSDFYLLSCRNNLNRCFINEGHLTWIYLDNSGLEIISKCIDFYDGFMNEQNSLLLAFIFQSLD